MAKNWAWIFSLLFIGNVYAADQPQYGLSPLSICTVDGITCTSPYKLKVSNGTLTNNGDGTSTVTTGGGAGGSGNVGIGTINNVAYYVGTTTVGGSNKFSFNGTNVGIGTSNGTTLLDVRGAGKFSGLLTASAAINTSDVVASGVLQAGSLVSSPEVDSSLFSGGNFQGFGGFFSSDVTIQGVLSDNQNAIFGDGGSGSGIRIGANGDVYGIRREDGSDPLEIEYNSTVLGRGVRMFGGSSNYGSFKLMNDENVFANLDTGMGTFTFSPTGGFIIDGANGGATVQLTVSGSSGAGNYAIQAIGGQVGLLGSGNNGAGTATGYIGDALFAPSPSAFTANGGTYSFYGNVGIMYNAGNVSISTTVTRNTLDVKGSAAHGAYAGINSAPSNGMIVSGNVGVGTFTPDTLFQVGARSRFNVDSNGNVGIGTTSPVAPLNVVNTAAGARFNGNSASYSFFNIFNTNNTSGQRGYRWSFDNNRLTFQSTDDTGAFQANQVAIAQASGDMTVGKDGSGNITDYARLGVVGNDTSNATNGLEVLDSSAKALFLVRDGGNVGIGSANPGQLLDVQGNIRISALGSTLAVASGTNGCMGQSTLTSGVVTVSTTCTPATSLGIFLTDAQSSLTNVGSVTIATVTAGTSFVIQSTNILDSSKVNWWVQKAS